jgi:hypothetical protein
MKAIKASYEPSNSNPQERRYMKVIDLSFCCYAVTDMTRAREFYEGLLNLKPRTVTDTDDGQWTEYEFGPFRTKS